MDDEQKNLHHLFVEMMELNSVDNHFSAQLYFHVFLGAYLKDIKIVDGISQKDLRFSYSWIQTSRTGKGRMNKALKKISDYCGLKCVIITSYNTAGIIGTIDGTAIDENKKWLSYGLTESNSPIEVDIKGKKKLVYYKNPIILGDAGTQDILIFDELKILLNPSKENLEIMLDIQPALDTPPHIRKKMKFELPVEYSHPISIIGTTFPFKNIGEILGTQGFLQRTFILVRVLTDDEIKAMREKQFTLMTPDIREKFDTKLRIFKRKLEELKPKTKLLNINEKAQQVLRQIREAYFERLKDYQGAEKEMLLSFSSTMEETCIKLAGQYCVLLNKTIIDDIEIKRVYVNLVKYFEESIFTKIEIRQNKEDKEETDKIFLAIKNQMRLLAEDKLTTEQIAKILMSIYHCGRNKALIKIKNLTSSGYFKLIKGDKNVTYYKLKED